MITSLCDVSVPVWRWWSCPSGQRWCCSSGSRCTLSAPPAGSQTWGGSGARPRSLGYSSKSVPCIPSAHQGAPAHRNHLKLICIQRAHTLTTSYWSVYKERIYKLPQTYLYPKSAYINYLILICIQRAHNYINYLILICIQSGLYTRRAYINYLKLVCIHGLYTKTAYINYVKLICIQRAHM